MSAMPHEWPILDEIGCDRFGTGLVTDYLDGGLPAQQTEEVEFHLLTCADCAELLHTHRHVATLLRGLRRP